MKIKNILAVSMLSLFISGHVMAAETKGVVATIKPLHSLVEGVMGETGTPELLITGNVSPHEFQLKPSQMRVLQSANVVFYIDDSFEAFLHDAFETLPAHVRKAAIAQKAGITLLSQRKGGAWEAHKHEAREHEAEEEHAHHDEHDSGHDDMHVWLDPVNAEKIVKFITKELSAVYPENKDIYKTNANALVKRLNSLDAKLKKDLAGLKDKPFIVFHDAYQYFERRYGLSGVGSITFEPDESPLPNRIKEVREKLQKTGAKCVFREPYFSGKLVDTVIEGGNAKSGTLDPEGTALESGKDLYVILMENLSDDLKKCLVP